MKVKSKPVPQPTSNLPVDGMSRWNQLKHFVPFSKETFRKMSKEGKAPMGIQITLRCTCYSNKEMHRFFEDISNYSSEKTEDVI